MDNDGSIAIAKFPSAEADGWNVMAWEKVALDLASAAGIDVPRSRLVDLAGRQVLLVERFDRAAGGDRVGFVSAMTMLEATDGDQRSYLEVAGGGSWRLAPAFDLNPNPEPGVRYLSTAIDDSDATASLTLALDVAEYFRLDEARSRAVLDEVVTAVRGWPRVAARHGRTPREIDAMSDAFAALDRVSG